MISNHDWITISRLSPITTLSLVHRSSDTVSNHDVLTPEIEIDHTNGSHRLVSSTYSSVPSILTSVMLICGDGLTSANDVMSINDCICSSGFICSIVEAVLSDISIIHVAIDHEFDGDNVLMSIIDVSLSPDHKSGSDWPDHNIVTHSVSDTMTDSQDTICHLDHCCIVHQLSSDSEAISHSVSDMLSSAASCSCQCNVRLVPIVLPISDHHNQWSISSATTIGNTVWHIMTIIDNRVRHWRHRLTYWDIR